MKVRAKEIQQVKWQDLIDIQKEVKQISPQALEKMINSLKTNGFCDPFIYWKNPAGENICLAGNQRLKALKEMKKAGTKIPDKLPAIHIKAKSEKEASTILLSLASNFGEIQEDELESFIEVSGLDPVEIENITHFVEIQSDDSLEEVKDDKKIDQIVQYLKLPFSKDKFDIVQSNLELAYKQLSKTNKSIESESDVVQYLLNQFLKID